MYTDVSYESSGKTGDNVHLKTANSILNETAVFEIVYRKSDCQRDRGEREKKSGCKSHLAKASI